MKIGSSTELDELWDGVYSSERNTENVIVDGQELLIDLSAGEIFRKGLSQTYRWATSWRGGRVFANSGGRFELVNGAYSSYLDYGLSPVWRGDSVLARGTGTCVIWPAQSLTIKDAKFLPLSALKGVMGVVNSARHGLIAQPAEEAPEGLRNGSVMAVGTYTDYMCLRDLRLITSDWSTAHEREGAHAYVPLSPNISIGRLVAESVELTL